jgi:hypothetical protein
MKMTTIAMSLVSVAGLGLLAAAGPAAFDCCTPLSAPAAGETALDPIRKLAGSWESADEDKDGRPDVTATYKVTSGGSAVVETLFPGTDHEMVTIYHMDGADLLVTHYCHLGNQPRMKAEPQKDRNVYVFKFKDGTNLDPKKDGYMGALTMTIVDADHVGYDWVFFQEGKEQHHKTFELARKR